MLGLGLSPEDQELLFKASRAAEQSRAELNERELNYTEKRGEKRRELRVSRQSKSGFNWTIEELSQKKKGAAMAWDLDGVSRCHRASADDGDAATRLRITSSARLSTLPRAQLQLRCLHKGVTLR